MRGSRVRDDSAGDDGQGSEAGGKDVVMKNEPLNETLKVFQQAGLDPTVAHGGKHLKVRAEKYGCRRNRAHYLKIRNDQYSRSRHAQ